MDRKLSIGIRINNASPSHVHFSLFSNMIPTEMDHAQATRGKAGDLCLRVEEFGAFLCRLRPDVISDCLSLSDGMDLDERLGAQLWTFAEAYEYPAPGADR